MLKSHVRIMCYDHCVIITVDICSLDTCVSALCQMPVTEAPRNVHFVFCMCVCWCICMCVSTCVCVCVCVCVD